MKWVIGILTVLLCLGVVMAKFNMPTFTSPVNRGTANTTVVKVYGDHEKALELFKKDGRRQLEIFRNLDSLNPMFQQPPRMVRYEDGSWLQIVSNFGREVVTAFGIRPQVNPQLHEPLEFYYFAVQGNLETPNGERGIFFFPITGSDDPLFFLPGRFDGWSDLKEDHEDYRDFLSEFWHPETMEQFSLARTYNDGTPYIKSTKIQNDYVREQLPWWCSYNMELYHFYSVYREDKYNYDLYISVGDEKIPIDSGTYRYRSDGVEDDKWLCAELLLHPPPPDSAVQFSSIPEYCYPWVTTSLSYSYPRNSTLSALAAVDTSPNSKGGYCCLYQRETGSSHVVMADDYMISHQVTTPYTLTREFFAVINGNKISLGNRSSSGMVSGAVFDRIVNPYDDNINYTYRADNCLISNINGRVFYMIGVDDYYKDEQIWLVSDNGNSPVYFKYPARQSGYYTDIKVKGGYIHNTSRFGIVRHRYALDELNRKVPLLDAY